MDSVQASRRSARYSIFEEVGNCQLSLRIHILLRWLIYIHVELGLVGGTISMITGLSLLDIIEAIVVIMAIIWAQHKIRTRLSSMQGES